jgi:hypothetical protein
MTELSTYTFFKMTSGTDMISRKEFIRGTLVPYLFTILRILIGQLCSFS